MTSRMRAWGVITALALAPVVVPATALAQSTSGAGAAPASATSAAARSGDIDFAAAIDAQRDRGHSDTYSGWHLGASYRAYHLINVVGEIGGEYRSAAGFTVNQYSYSGGVRFESPGPARVAPFAQILMGATQDNGRTTKSALTNHYPVVAPGAGIDLRAAPRAAIRARVDFPLYMTFGDVFKGTRFSLGVAVPLGAR